MDGEIWKGTEAERWREAIIKVRRCPMRFIDKSRQLFAAAGARRL